MPTISTGCSNRVMLEGASEYEAIDLNSTLLTCRQNFGIDGWWNAFACSRRVSPCPVDNLLFLENCVSCWRHNASRHHWSRIQKSVRPSPISLERRASPTRTMDRSMTTSAATPAFVVTIYRAHRLPPRRRTTTISIIKFNSNYEFLKPQRGKASGARSAVCRLVLSIVYVYFGHAGIDGNDVCNCFQSHRSLITSHSSCHPYFPISFLTHP